MGKVFMHAAVAIPLLLLVLTPCYAGDIGASSTQMPGAELSKMLSKTTGAAINPLLTSGFVGALKYYSTPSELRNNLPWYASPKFWIPVLLVGASFVINGTIGSLFPPLSMPMNAMENLEKKVTPIFIAAPMLLSTLTLGTLKLSASVPSDNVVRASILPIGFDLVPLLLLISTICAFIIVWFFAQMLDTLSLILSAMPGCSIVINLFKYGLLAVVMISPLIHPFLGIAVSLLIILFAWLIFGWCFRFTVFGTITAWDILTFKHKRIRLAPETINVFSACRIGKVPKRSYGELKKNIEGVLTFAYRPYLIFPARVVNVPTGNLFMEKGNINLSIYAAKEGARKDKRIFDLPPRYRTHEYVTGKILAIDEIRDSKVITGIKASIQWFKDLIWSGKKEQFIQA